MLLRFLVKSQKLRVNGCDRSGFTLLFAVLVGSLLFSLGIAIANVAIKELVLSAAGKESEAAFFAADAGSECALYYDRRVPGTFPNSFTAPRDPDGRIRCNQKDVPLTFEPALSGVATTTFRLAFEKTACADVIVGKVRPQGLAPGSTVIESRGRNDCGVGDNPGRVERAVRVRY